MELLDQIFILVTYLGSDLFVLSALPFVYLYKRKLGLKIALSVLFTIYLTSIFKMFFRVERPNPIHWKVSASGYSFPSGHSSLSASFWGFLAIQYREDKKVFVFANVLYILVGLSRIYLGVHWWFDVVGGWILGLSIALLTYMYFDEIKELLERFGFVEKFVSITATYLIMVFIAYGLSIGAEHDFYNAIRVSSALFGVFLGLLFGGSVYREWVDGENFKQFISRGLIGLIIVLIPFLVARIYENILTVLVAYTLIGLLLTTITPMLIKKLDI